MKISKVPENISFGEKDTFGFGVDARLDVGNITPKAVWDNRDELHRFAQESMEFWENMDATRQESLVRVIKSALERMYDHADEWVPEAIKTEGMSGEGGQYLDVNLRVIFTDIEREFERYYRASSFQIEQAAKDAARMAADEDAAE